MDILERSWVCTTDLGFPDRLRPCLARASGTSVSVEA
jgi:hypothetical protein